MAFSWIQGIIFCLLLLCLGTRETPIIKQSNTTQAHLLRYLMDGYEARLRPVRDWKKEVVVQIDIRVIAIISVDEKEQVLTIHYLFIQYWRDEFLQWNPMDFDNITTMSVPQQNIWFPDLHIGENVDSVTSSGYNFVYISNTGLIKYQSMLKESFACQFNIYFFPFDVHDCLLSFHSQLHTVEHINLSAWRTAEQMKKDLRRYYRGGEWDFSSMFSTYHLGYFDGSTFAILIFHIVFKRVPLYYIVNLIMPSLFLMILDIIGFYLPNYSGERISFKITLLLGYSVFLIIVMDTLPPSSHSTPILATYFVVCMALLGLGLAESILVFRIASYQNLQYKVPTWIRKLVLEKLSILVCMKDNDLITEPYKQSPETLQKMSTASSNQLDKYAKIREATSQSPTVMEARKDILENIFNEIVTIRQYVKYRISNETNREWLLVGFILDTCLFRLYLLIVMSYIVVITICWTYLVVV